MSAETVSAASIAQATVNAAVLLPVDSAITVPKNGQRYLADVIGEPIAFTYKVTKPTTVKFYLQATFIPENIVHRRMDEALALTPTAPCPGFSPATDQWDVVLTAQQLTPPNTSVAVTAGGIFTYSQDSLWCISSSQYSAAVARVIGVSSGGGNPFWAVVTALVCPIDHRVPVNLTEASVVSVNSGGFPVNAVELVAVTVGPAVTCMTPVVELTPPCGPQCCTKPCPPCPAPRLCPPCSCAVIAVLNTRTPYLVRGSVANSAKLDKWWLTAPVLDSGGDPVWPVLTPERQASAVLFSAFYDSSATPVPLTGLPGQPLAWYYGVGVSVATYARVVVTATEYIRLGVPSVTLHYLALEAPDTATDSRFVVSTVRQGTSDPSAPHGQCTQVNIQYIDTPEEEEDVRILDAFVATRSGYTVDAIPSGTVVFATRPEIDTFIRYYDQGVTFEPLTWWVTLGP